MESSIAQDAIEPRDRSRLLVTSSMEDRRFSDLADELTPGDLLVVNTTRVRAARIRGTKVETGGGVEVLLLERLDDEDWRALVKPARRIRPGMKVDFPSMTAEILTEPVQGEVTLRLTTAAEARDVDDVLPEVGEVPLPPYFHGTLDDPERYQSIFATTIGSAAASTAALHFTPAMLGRIGVRGVGMAAMELDIGLDTFRPINAALTQDHVIHAERFAVPAETVEAVQATKAAERRVVAVGTTALRALESAAGGDGTIAAGEGRAELFVTPGYEPLVVDALVTNFHAPRTTLIALVAAMLGIRWRDVYAEAQCRGYRFLSFGDAMYIDGWTAE